MSLFALLGLTQLKIEAPLTHALSARFRGKGHKTPPRVRGGHRAAVVEWGFFWGKGVTPTLY